MKLLRDPFGRPIPRLYFNIDELDRECEQIVTNFMDRHSAGFSLPVPTDDIIRMIEIEADDLDMYADLPEELDGYTDFFFERRPWVRIAKRLSDPRYENRLRMTLGHEFGHVRFHAPMERRTGRPRPTAGGAVLDLQPGHHNRGTRERLDGVASGVHRWRALDASRARQALSARTRGARRRGGCGWCRFRFGSSRDPPGDERLPGLSTGRAGAPCEAEIAEPNLRIALNSRA